MTLSRYKPGPKTAEAAALNKQLQGLAARIQALENGGGGSAPLYKTIQDSNMTEGLLSLSCIAQISGSVGNNSNDVLAFTGDMLSPVVVVNPNNASSAIEWAWVLSGTPSTWEASLADVVYTSDCNSPGVETPRLFARFVGIPASAIFVELTLLVQDNNAVC
jgi:hypothetical protein